MLTLRAPGGCRSLPRCIPRGAGTTKEQLTRNKVVSIKFLYITLRPTGASIRSHNVNASYRESNVNTPPLQAVRGFLCFLRHAANRLGRISKGKYRRKPASGNNAISANHGSLGIEYSVIRYANNLGRNKMSFHLSYHGNCGAGFQYLSASPSSTVI